MQSVKTIHLKPPDSLARLIKSHSAALWVPRQSAGEGGKREEGGRRCEQVGFDGQQTGLFLGLLVCALSGWVVGGRQDPTVSGRTPDL